MFNVGSVKQLFYGLVLVLNLIKSIIIYPLTFYKNLISRFLRFPFNFFSNTYFYIKRQFFTSRAKRLGSRFKPILITKKNAKRLISLFYSIIYIYIGWVIFTWPLKNTGAGSIILDRFLFISRKLILERNMYFYLDTKIVCLLIKIFSTTHLTYVIYFSKVLVPIILITISFSERIAHFWFNTIRNSLYFLINLYFIFFIFIFIKALLILSWYLFLNATYHLFLCIVVCNNHYFLVLDCSGEVIYMIYYLLKHLVVVVINNFFKSKLDFVVNWIFSSYFYLILNLVINIFTQTIPNLIINWIISFILFIKQIIYIINSLSIIILNLVVIILFILIGGIIPLVERKYLSLIQRRIGPKFVGYNGRLQFIADALKLLFKEIIFLINTNKISFVAIPFFLLNLNIFLLINLVWVNNLFYIDNEYFVLLILLIELITSIYTAYLGFIVKNKYTIIASTRVLNGVIVFEIFLITIYFYLYIINSKLNLDNVYFNQIFNLKLKINLIILPPIVYTVLLNLKKVPFDIIEAETELIMGYTTEHSGFLGGALLLIEYLHLFFWSLLILTLFLI